MQSTEPEPVSPYKFLHYYRKKDRGIFFGRKAETQVLLSDVAVTRLVVLFAKTGTGKTSLINAGVRPVLEEDGYATFFIRVKRDPIESARKAIVEPEPEEQPAPAVVWPASGTFSERLEAVAEQLNKDIVLFFDQFEEFFIYPLDEAALPAGEAEDERLRGRGEQLRRRQEFIENVAAIYHDKKSRVHLVFSMREEWFVELDIFRDLIPKIFHNDSNLRLRWFSRTQARDAIRLPALLKGVKVTDDVVDRLINDLSDNGKTEIEPAQLQIVCDTLWWSGDADSITLADYERLGRLEAEPAGARRDAGKESIARRILFRRLGKEFEAIGAADDKDGNDDEQLQLLYALLPKLGTPWGTKYVRDINGLVKELISDDPALREAVTDDVAYQSLVEKLKKTDESLHRLINRLQEKVGLVRKGMRDNLEVVELAHDYLVANLAELQARVKAIPPRRALDRVMGRGWGVLAAPEELELISDSAAVLAVSKKQAAKMFRSALSRGQESHTRLWFGLAGEPRAWAILRKSLANIETSSYAIRFLAELGDPRAFELLGGVLSNEEIASYVIEIFSRKESREVVDFLSGVALKPGLLRKARKALKSIRKTARDPAVSERARAALERLDEDESASQTPEPGADGRGVRGGGDGDASGAGGRGASESEPEPAISAESLTPHFKSVNKSLREGRINVFLGADAGRAGSGAGNGWKPGKSVPSVGDLASHLAATFHYPPGQPDSRDLARVAQYAAATVDREELYRVLRDAFEPEPEPSRLHRLLPRLASEAGGPSGSLILTAAYDDLLERAFDERGVEFDLLTYVARGPHAGRFLHVPPGEEPRPIEIPFEYRGLTASLPVVIKVSGGIVRAGAEYDSFVIAEDDYIEQLSLSDIVSLLPLTLAARLRRSHFLFLGYSPRDWNVRVLLQRIWGRRRLGYQSWAIQPGHDPVEQALWRELGVECFNMSLERYADELEGHVYGRTQEA